MKSLHANQKADFYRNTKRGKILRAMTLTDITHWGMDAFIGLILVLFVIQYIDGGNATHLGLAYFLYKFVAATASIPIGKFFDRHKGYIDEVTGLALASFIAGGTYVLLSFATELWQLYAAMAVLGFSTILNLTSWRIVFYTNVRKSVYGETVAIYHGIYYVAEGLLLALGGFFGDTFGFQSVVLWGGVIIFAGGFIPLTIRYLVPKK